MNGEEKKRKYFVPAHNTERQIAGCLKISFDDNAITRSAILTSDINNIDGDLTATCGYTQSFGLSFGKEYYVELDFKRTEWQRF
jgi:hypothetical protein